MTIEEIRYEIQVLKQAGYLPSSFGLFQSPQILIKALQKYTGKTIQLSTE